MDKISLIKLKEEHFPLFYKWWNDPTLRRLTSEVKGKMPKSEVDNILKKHLKNKKGFDFIITVNKKPIGHILIQKKDRKKYFEVYIAIGEKRFWDRGVGTIAMKKTCHWFFKKFPKEKQISLEVLVNNIRAIKSYKKVGFKKIKIVHNKNKTDTYLMTLTNIQISNN